MRKQHLFLLFTLLLPWAAKAQSAFPFRDAQLKWGVIDTGLRVITPATYDTVLFYKDGYTIARKAGQSIHLDSKGEALYPGTFDSLGYFDYNYEGSGYEGLAIARQGGYYGLISPAGQFATEFQPVYEHITLETPAYINEYDKPLVFIYKKEGLYGCKLNGKQIGKAIYDKIYVNFGNPKHLFFERGGKEYYLNQKGKIKSSKRKKFVFTALGDPLYFVVSSLEVFEQNNLKGLKHIDTGETIVPAVYQHIRFEEMAGFVLITPEQQFGLVDYTGYRLLEDKYKNMVLSPEEVLMVEAFSGQKGYWVNGKLLMP